MEFRNLTPFAVMNYSMLDVDDVEHHVAVMKIGYELLPDGQGHCIAELLPAPPLCLQDEYRGAMNASPVLQESDLAPFKPRCDVIVNGTAYAPAGQPGTEFPVRLSVHSQQGQTLLDKTLTLSGEREYIRVAPGEWQLTAPKPVERLPLDYRYAFGGECKMAADDKAGRHLPDTARLTPEQRRQHPDGEANAPVAHGVWEANPLGCGFITPWYAQAKPPTRWPAPRITAPDAPLTAAHFAAQLNGTLPPATPATRPQGFGFIGRAWTPRRPLSGTYDDDWLAHRHPYLPKDFDFRYWNGAPADQQIDWPDTDISLRLQGMTPGGNLHVTLPGHRPFMLLRMHEGGVLPVPMRLDTLILDSEALTLHLTFRLNFKTSLPIRVAEARFEIDPDAPLLKFAAPEPEKETAHGG
ncbi:DUF2169 family type VI secretion system accessory protein [Xenorhabdus bovienii]|uniref:DUF2169 family type VI secretion system accessory protein n=1 Tax=Xenorhabdus bovienii TaxID=40576 RepID=UPI0023B31549|nr:DUF2169 domain-containing protein [Xenorhabdus bovienii]MDE9459732.1 DUF2169 domain-containing protein [Xenorhabdus bovienii]MDE9488204.1 DUF2169 domain-containing protein [Xenorhabdus bovienii]MDE9516064.1 DUF2169 domain-containing protein [Xenorhabdus bovienii]